MKKFDIVVPIPRSMPVEYYLIDNIPVSKKQFESGQFGEMIKYSRCVTRIVNMTMEEIIEKFGFTPSVLNILGRDKDILEQQQEGAIVFEPPTEEELEIIFKNMYNDE